MTKRIVLSAAALAAAMTFTACSPATDQKPMAAKEQPNATPASNAVPAAEVKIIRKDPRFDKLVPADAKVEKLAIDTLAEYFPNLESSIVHRKSITPLDLEQTYGLTEGDINHGQLMLDQFLFMRPIPGWSQLFLHLRRDK